jgi:hypothetical protein
MPAARRAGPRRRRALPSYGAVIVPLPLVATIGVTAVTQNAATLIGSVNPQGEAGSMWFSWGTGSAPPTETPAQPLAATNTSTTFTFDLTGLQTGVQVFFACVAQTPAGTVSGAQMTFVPAQPPAVQSQPEPSLGGAQGALPPISIPHFQYPFSMNGGAGAATVEQGSTADILSQVQMVLACPAGGCPELPSFGRPDLTFGPNPPPAARLLAAIQAWVPGATTEIITTAVNQADAVAAVTVSAYATATGE